MDTKEYLDAYATVTTADKDTVTTAADVVATLTTAFAAANSALQGLQDQYSDITGPVMGARQTVASLIGKLGMLEFTLVNATDEVTSALAAYNPPVIMTPPAPVTPAS